MRASNLPFSIEDSNDRISEILNTSDNSYEENKSIPPEESLTFDNGFYVDITALFIDIRDSSKLTRTHTRPVLGKIYRAYVSECVAVINSDPNCRQIFIEGDAVVGVFSTQYTKDVDTVFETAGKLASLNLLLNYNLEQKGYSKIQCGIGLADGNALMIKAGHKGSAVNEVVWIGKTLSEAAHLSDLGNKGTNHQVQLSTKVYECLKKQYKNLCKPVYETIFEIHHYQATIGNIQMHEWLRTNWDAALIPLTPADPD